MINLKAHPAPRAYADRSDGAMPSEEPETCKPWCDTTGCYQIGRYYVVDDGREKRPKALCDQCARAAGLDRSKGVADLDLFHQLHRDEWEGIGEDNRDDATRHSDAVRSITRVPPRNRKPIWAQREGEQAQRFASIAEAIRVTGIPQQTVFWALRFNRPTRGWRFSREQSC